MLLLNSFRYNNKTYRIDDIAWDHTPNNTFKRGDTDISFKNYYKNVGALKTRIGVTENNLSGFLPQQMHTNNP